MNNSIDPDVKESFAFKLPEPDSESIDQAVLDFFCFVPALP